MTKKDIQEFIYHKKSTREVKSQEDFGLKIGYQSKSSFSQAISKIPIPEEVFEKINKVYPDFYYWKNRNTQKEPAEIKKGSTFEELPVSEQLSVIYNSIQDLTRMIETKTSIQDEKIIRVMDYLEEYVSPIWEHIKVEETAKKK
ncbi:MAG: hypothetical protein JNN23_09105 [Chryseobacterium gambrini]|nr:hypothetical protein [Chryseobacterium gambrini]